MIGFKEAKSIVNSHLFRLGTETVQLNKSSDRTLAEDVVASFPSPMFDNSAMDGFAVRSRDTVGARNEKPVTLKMVSISAAGSPSDLEIGSGECAQCMTGAEIPKGADAVVMVEDTSGFSDSDTVKIFLETLPGKHIRKKGEEIKEQELLIPKGTPITSSELGTCATFGYSKLSVSKQPEITLFGTGNELVEPGLPLEAGQIYNSNLYMLSDLVEKAGGKVGKKEIIKDNKKSLRSFLSQTLQTSDVVITSGGISMGRYDYVREVFTELGVREHFWKVEQKPGKPLFFGTKDSTLIFGLPGNPISSYIGFMEWVWPALEYLNGKPKRKKLTGILTQPFPREAVKKRFLFGKAWIENNQLLCKPTTKIGSHMITSALGANCILTSSLGEGMLKEGEKITVCLLPWMPLK